MDKPIEVGDVVRLKSGGPAMTVGHINCPTTDRKDDQAQCCWVDENGDGRTYTFPVVCLRQH